VDRTCRLRTDRVSITLPGRVENIGRAREFVTASLGMEHPCAGALQLIVSELVTNSIVHSRSGRDGGMVTIVITGDATRVRVEVTDDGGTDLPRLQRLDFAAESGRGLHLVDALATTWDCGQDPAGTTTTWVEVTA
jgi:anti-sigma regulatory factor (Ser/Thr protein kinase)